MTAAREHLDRASAALETARRESDRQLAGDDIDPESATIPVVCGRCRATVPYGRFDSHYRRCEPTATTKALRSAVLEEVAMDRLSGRQMEEV